MEEVPISTIQIGDMIEVRAGEKIPVDGVVTQAESFMTPDAAYIDEAMISGEPTPAMKKAGDNVLAGTIPSQGKLRMRAKQIGENTALAHIIRMVQEAQGSKAPVQRIVDKAALDTLEAVLQTEVQHLAWPCGERPERLALRGAETKPQCQPRFADLRRACQQVQSLGEQIVDHEGDRFVSGALQRVRVNGLQSVHKKFSFLSWSVYFFQACACIVTWGLTFENR